MNLELKIFRNVVSVGQDLEGLDVLVLFNILGLDVADQVSHTVDVVSKCQATKSFNDNNANGLLVVAWSNVSEAHC